MVVDNGMNIDCPLVIKAHNDHLNFNQRLKNIPCGNLLQFAIENGPFSSLIYRF